MELLLALVFNLDIVLISVKQVLRPKYTEVHRSKPDGRAARLHVDRTQQCVRLHLCECDGNGKCLSPVRQPAPRAQGCTDRDAG